MNPPRETIQQVTRDYESWLDGQLVIIRADLDLKHRRMAEAAFPFLRATYYRWAQLFPEICPDLAAAPEVLAVGDLHIENFGTWRDGEGRLVWGINDFDETCRLPYVHDLVRLATSAHLAVESCDLVRVNEKQADEAILRGYQRALEAGGRAVVLAEHSRALRQMAVHRLADPPAFWHKLENLPRLKTEVPAKALRVLSDMLPSSAQLRRVVHRVAGLGSLGRQRFVALAEWQCGKIAREAKALAPSAAVWAHGREGKTKILYQTILDQAVRSVDPWVNLRRRWIVRRLAPDCSRIELIDLPRERDDLRLLEAMGWETANVHLGSRTASALLVDLASREKGWLHRAAKLMAEAVREDWKAWRASPVPAARPAGKPKKKGEDAAAAPEKKAKARSEPVREAKAKRKPKGAKKAKAKGKKTKRPKAKPAQPARKAKRAKPAAASAGARARGTGAVGRRAGLSRTPKARSETVKPRPAAPPARPRSRRPPSVRAAVKPKPAAPATATGSPAPSRRATVPAPSGQAAVPAPPGPAFVTVPPVPAVVPAAPEPAPEKAPEGAPASDSDVATAQHDPREGA